MNSDNYWWVGHNQTFDSEINGYLWSPKLNRAGHTNQFYENMTLVSPGDLVFSFAASRIKAIGIIQTPAQAFRNSRLKDEHCDA